MKQEGPAKWASARERGACILPSDSYSPHSHWILLSLLALTPLAAPLQVLLFNIKRLAAEAKKGAISRVSAGICMHACAACVSLLCMVRMCTCMQVPSCQATSHPHPYPHPYPHPHSHLSPLALTLALALTHTHALTLTSHLSPLTSHLSPLTLTLTLTLFSHLSPLTSYLSPLTSHPHPHPHPHLTPSPLTSHPSPSPSP